jgi:hypothetical protein
MKISSDHHLSFYAIGPNESTIEERIFILELLKEEKYKISTTVLDAVKYHDRTIYISFDGEVKTTSLKSTELLKYKNIKWWKNNIKYNKKLVDNSSSIFNTKLDLQIKKYKHDNRRSI